MTPRVIGRPGAWIAVMECPPGVRGLWVFSRGRRQGTVCVATDAAIAQGEAVFRPLTNRAHRGARVRASWVYLYPRDDERGTRP